jgi:diguanylate cyclase (GGDEF)-like protein/putative nucleotidyltransferase with HDIG domain
MAATERALPQWAAQKRAAVPARIQLLICVQVALLVPSLLAVATLPPPTDWVLVGLLVVATGLFSIWKVELPLLEGKMTPIFAIQCLALLLGGAHAALLVTLCGISVGCLLVAEGSSWRLRRVRWTPHKFLFNVANCTLACSLAVLVHAVVLPLLEPGAGQVVGGLLAFTTVYFMVNTVGISLALANQQNTPWPQVWRNNFLWTAPAIAASASAAAAIMGLYNAMGSWALIAVAPLHLVCYWYRLYVERVELYAARMKQDMAHIEELNHLNQSIVLSLATAIDAKDSYTCSHINRVQKYAVALAEAAGVVDAELEAVRTGALVHDIGKLGVPDHILGKPGKLTRDEFERIKAHVEIGAEILAPVPFPFPVVDVVLTHHERWDGLGYPRGLQGDAIPIGGRIIGVVDVFDALTSDRPYRKAMLENEALQILREGAGKQFDPNLVSLFEQILPRLREEIRVIENPDRLQPLSSEVDSPRPALQQINEAAAEMAAVCGIARSLAEEETVEGVAQAVVDQVLKLVPGDTAILYLTLPSKTELCAFALSGRFQEKLAGMTIQLGEGVAGCVVDKCAPKMNVSAALDIARRFSPDENMELSSASAVPLGNGDPPAGALVVYTMGYNLHSAHHLRILEVLAERAAVAIQSLNRVTRNAELAFIDPVTGLANHRSLLRKIDHLIDCHQRAEDSAPFCVVMLDLNRFKEVNDCLGHLHGDELLVDVGRRLQALTGPRDTVARYGGDEFVLLLPGARRERAAQIAVEACTAIRSLGASPSGVTISASAGIAVYPEDGAERRTLIETADRRMYEQKFRDAETSTEPPPVLVP